jgi:hypothetical protein
MSVLAELKSIIENLGFAVEVMNLEKFKNSKPKHNPVVTVHEFEANYDLESDSNFFYRIETVISIGIYVRDPSDSAALETASSIRDKIIECIKANLFANKRIIVKRWNQEYEDEPQVGSYLISTFYEDWE